MAPPPRCAGYPTHEASGASDLHGAKIILTGSALPLFPVEPGRMVVAETRSLGRSYAQIDD